MLLHGWNEIDANPQWPLECSSCHRTFPEGEGHERYYTPFWNDDNESLAEEFQKVFGMDPYADFLICKECLEIDACLEPAKWLEKWREEEQGLLSRHECINMLEEE